MKSVIDFFKGLFDTRWWPDRWHCGYWSDFHGWLFILSDLMIWLVYFLIPIILFRYVSKDVSRIFEAFTRLNSKSAFEGSGIGLAICRKIVAVHKGNIQVISKPGEGTTFIVDLPSANE